MRGKYYARIRVWDGYKQTDQVIPLKTTPIANKDRNGKITLEPCGETLRHLKEVEKTLPYILNGSIKKHQSEEYFMTSF